VKTSIRYGGVVRCDMVSVRETKDDVIFEHACDEKFVTYSMTGLARAQAAFAGWIRVKAKCVQWPGTPPVSDGKKVDLCPKHRGLAERKMTAPEAVTP